MIKRFLIAALALVMGVAPSAFAIQIESDGNRGAANRILTAVFNNAANNLTSGSVVVWDTAAATAAANLGAYVTTTTSTNAYTVAGVVFSDTILTGGIGTICVYGPMLTLTEDSTSKPTVGNRVGTGSVAGQCGSGTGLGVVLRISGSGVDGETEWIFVNPSNGV